MRPLLLASAAAMLVATPQPSLVAQTATADAAAPALRIASRDSARDPALSSPGTAVLTRDARHTPAANADLMGPNHSVVSQRTDDSTQTQDIVGGLALRMVTNGAGFVTLADGTEWRIALEDRPQVQQWRPGDRVIVRLAPIGRQPRFDYILVNARDGSEALVALGQPDVRD